NDDQPIALENVTSDILRKVLEFCEYHRSDPLPSDEEPSEQHQWFNSTKRQPDICEWDSNFVAAMDRDTLLDIVLAANSLDIKPLLDAGCKNIADKIRGKTTGEIREFFNVPNDLTPEEEEQIKREN
ncbi:Skp1 family, dimerization domain-containing protein, partial [Cyathus striatus]